MSKSPLEIIKSKLSNPNVSSETEDIICELYKLGCIRNEDFYMELNALCNRIDAVIMENSKKNAGNQRVLNTLF